MDDPDPAGVTYSKQLTPGEKLACWTVGTFQTCLLVVIPVLLLYTAGVFNETGESFEEAGNLGSLIGIVLFVALWGCTVYSTMQAFRESQIMRIPGGPIDLNVVSFASKWGGANGVYFLGALVAILAVITAAAAVTTSGLVGLWALLPPFIVGIFGALPAFVIGIVVGFVLSPIVSLLHYFARISSGRPTSGVATREGVL